MTKFTSKVVLFFAVLAVAQIVHGVEDHDVGDDTKWTSILPSPNFYTTWAANETFRVGDSLEFDFVTGAHTVAIVNKAAYDACTAANPIRLITTGPAKVPLTATGPQYFICTVGGHCNAGQKLAIEVMSATGTPTTTPTTPSGTAPTTPSGTTPTTPGTTPTTTPGTPGAASSISPATVLAILVSVAVAILC